MLMRRVRVYTVGDTGGGRRREEAVRACDERQRVGVRLALQVDLGDGEQGDADAAMVGAERPFFDAERALEELLRLVELATLREHLRDVGERDRDARAVAA